MDELLIAANPDPESRLPYLLRLPLAGGMVFRTSGTWPRTKALYCYPVAVDEWPDDAGDRRAGAAALLRAPRRGDRPGPRPGPGEPLPAGVHHRPRPRRGVLAVPAHPQAGPPERAHPDRPRRPASPTLEIVVDSHEQYPYRFASQQVRTVKRALPCGDYGITVDGRLVAVGGTQVPSRPRRQPDRRQAALRARPTSPPCRAPPSWSRTATRRIFKLDRVRPAVVADGLAELQVRWPNVPIVFCETRPLAEEWTYRYLAAAHAWASTELALAERIGGDSVESADSRHPAHRNRPPPRSAPGHAPTASPCPTAAGCDPDIWQAWRDAQQP